MRIPVRSYDFFAGNRVFLWLSLALATIVLSILALRLDFSEDIGDFLPVKDSEREYLSVYQKISGADNLFIIFSNPGDESLTAEAIGHFTEAVHGYDTEGWCEGLTSGFDLDALQEAVGFVYRNIPYFLTESDYARMDSLLSLPGYIPEQLERDRKMLMFPSGGLLAASVPEDPLNLYSSVISELNTSDGRLNFEMYDGCIFTPDLSRAVVMLRSPFGNSETEQNAKLLKILEKGISSMESEYPTVSAHIAGGPRIAVDNASRIKKDSLIAISLSAVLIILLLAFSFHSLRNILLILASICWGWLFALGGIALFSTNVSIIVIGISSVILGIAVNYPLHLIAHTGHRPDVREALKEVMAPLVVGNITTVGAFLALIPLESSALHDLGLFASLLLVGTILFVLFCLPHLIKVRTDGRERKIRFPSRLSGFSPERCRPLVVSVAILTVILAIFSTGTSFDPDMSNINYVTDEQREDLLYFENLLDEGSSPDTRKVYVLSSGNSYEEALLDNESQRSLFPGRDVTSRFLVSGKEQERRLGLWRDFVSRHYTEFTSVLPETAARYGFSPEAFSRFLSPVENAGGLRAQDFSCFSPLTDLFFRDRVTHLEETGLYYIVNTLNVREDEVEEVKSSFRKCFDVAGMNGSLSRSLSDNFNYIGWACSLIVFLFLWFSFGRIELAVVAFLPMAVSWIWILGIMSVLGIRFNIVNVILATFIFGQGDDYTIFITEGCQYEYARRRPILSAYKRSIFQSALIMFVGIGTLIVARHPAMRSLAEVTIIGMFSVVFMAYLIPPLIFRWMTTSHGKARLHPITLRTLLFGIRQDPVSLVKGRYLYKGKEIMDTVRHNLDRNAGRLSGIDLSGRDGYTITDDGYGESALLLARTHPETVITAVFADADRMEIAEVAADGFVDNIRMTIDKKPQTI